MVSKLRGQPPGLGQPQAGSVTRWPPPNSAQAAEPRGELPSIVPATFPKEEAKGFVPIEGERELHYKSRMFTPAALSNSIAAGTDILSSPDLGFEARSVIITNLTSHTLWLPEVLGFVPPNQVGYIVTCRPATKSIRLQVLVNGGTGGTVYVVVDETPRDPTTGSLSVAGGAALQNVNITEVAGAALALGQALMAASLPVTIASNQGAIAENLTQVGGVAIALGQALKAASLPVTLASDQDNIPENLAQVGGAAIALGQNTRANSIPTTIASDQTTLPTVQTPGTGGIASSLRLNSASGTSANIKGAAGSIRALSLINGNAAIRYIHFYNKATAPVIGTDTPIWTVPLPAGAAAVLAIGDGTQFGTGIGYAVTTDDVAIPAVAGAAGDIQGTIWYS